MRSLLFPACLTAVVALGAELRTPAEVARDWHRLTAATRQPGVAQHSTLAAQSDLLTTTPLERIFQVDETMPAPPAGGWHQAPPLLDAPSSRVPKNLPNHRPKGAIPWEFNGEVYWLVPLTPKPVR